MKKAFVFSLTTMFFMIAILIIGISINDAILNERILSLHNIPSRINRDLFDTISKDILNVMGTKVNYNDNITINEIMPRNISKKYNDYLTFLNNVLLQNTINNVSFTHHNPLLFFNKTIVRYGYNKSWFNLSSEHNITYYALRINASDNALNITTSWPWTNQGIFVNITIMNLNKSIVLINNSYSGYINPLKNNILIINYSTGSLMVLLKNFLIVNTTIPINTSTIIGLKGNAYTGYVLKIKNGFENFTKEYNTTA